MYLSDRTILNRIDELFPSRIPEGVDLSVQLQPASVDLRLGTEFITNNWPAQVITQPFVLVPGVLLLATTVETVNVPSDLLGRVEGRSSWGRLGLRIHSTAGFIDPGFRGKITLEIDAIREVRIRPGARICQICFAKLDRECMVPYGSTPRSKYQNQNGVTPSALEEDDA
jgi:dCTP deaminase